MGSGWDMSQTLKRPKSVPTKQHFKLENFPKVKEEGLAADILRVYPKPSRPDYRYCRLNDAAMADFQHIYNKVQAKNAELFSKAKQEYSSLCHDKLQQSQYDGRILGRVVNLLYYESKNSGDGETAETPTNVDESSTAIRLINAWKRNPSKLREVIRQQSEPIAKSLCDQIFTLPIHWAKATGSLDAATHYIDFGPGGLSGIGGLTARNVEGRGVRVLIIGEKGKNGVEVYDAANVKREKWWEKAFQSALVKTSDGKVHIDSPFSRLLGKAPIMIAGTTPTTVKAGFVSAVLSAVYYIELAGGGHCNAKALRAKVAEIQATIPAGVGITLNALYINLQQFGFQFPLWQELKHEGLPIEGFCVAAGIPNTEKAAEIIDDLRTAGIKHVAFKPGSIDGIRQVVTIAAANPDFPIICQWTGGRAGGHHSYEDFHQPILATYGSIRQQSNISLIVGTGFGGS
ncbi:3-oxoacyl-[acyl-carrier-protein] synthase [Tulasnella sp. 424]|nr:3-oxoacyl-[acyl-carrier-protein] synthase [Tulasnella sp. 424]